MFFNALRASIGHTQMIKMTHHALVLFKRLKCIWEVLLLVHYCQINCSFCSVNKIHQLSVIYLRQKMRKSNYETSDGK